MIKVSPSKRKSNPEVYSKEKKSRTKISIEMQMFESFGK
jgi:hypothetical protein